MMRATLAERSVTALVGAFMLIWSAGLVRSEVATDCFSDDNERRLTGCTAIIESQTANDQERAHAFSTRALALSLKQQYGAAINDYDEAIRLVPNYSMALNNRAWAYYKWGRGGEGLADVEKSLRLNPYSEHSWDTRAHIRQVVGDHAGALADYEQAIAIGGERMVKIYQCGLSSSGLYRGRLDGIYSDELRDALKTCANSKTCDPLPADEECKDPVS